MTLKEAIKLKVCYEFEKKTVVTEESGDHEVFHYFSITINGCCLHLASEDKRPWIWYGSIFDLPIKFYTYESFDSVIKSVQNGEWADD
jgi:hypothetical protein